MYEANLIHSSNGSTSQNIIKTEAIPTVLHLNSAVVTTDTDKATLFNQYFHLAFTTSSSTLPDMGSPAIELLQSIDISEADVYNAPTSLDHRKALGIDGIGPKILKICSESLF